MKVCQTIKTSSNVSVMLHVKAFDYLPRGGNVDFENSSATSLSHELGLSSFSCGGAVDPFGRMQFFHHAWKRLAA